jgi:hypothetical protein
MDLGHGLGNMSQHAFNTQFDGGDSLPLPDPSAGMYLLYRTTDASAILDATVWQSTSFEDFAT